MKNKYLPLVKVLAIAHKWNRGNGVKLLALAELAHWQQREFGNAIETGRAIAKTQFARNTFYRHIKIFKELGLVQHEGPPNYGELSLTDEGWQTVNDLIDIMRQTHAPIQNRGGTVHRTVLAR